jgi:maleamate amidohydrolase
VTGLYGAPTERTYADAGFGAAVRRGRRPAIVVVDLTNGFTDPAAPTGADLSRVVADTGGLIETGRPADVPVVFTTIAYTPAEADGDAVAWLTKAPGMRALREGSHAVALDPRLPVEPGDHLVTKKGASAFFGTGLAALLTGLRVDTVIVCGATTSGCVRATAVDAVQSGFPVLVPRQCVGDRAAGPHEANLFDIQAKYGDVIDVDEARGYLTGLAAEAMAR